MAELTSTVHVHDEHGVAHAFGPGDTVPKWAADKITNPKAWSGTAAAGHGKESTTVIPPKGGPKATAEAWAEYAKAKGFEIEGDATRTEIIAALEAENIPTE